MRQGRCRLAGEYASASATASAPSASASRLSSGMHLHDLHHLLHDQQFLHCVFSTLPGHSSARPGPHLVSLALELLLVPPHLHQVLSLHHVGKLLKMRCCQACSPILRLCDFSFESCAATFRVSVSSLPPRGIGTRGHPSVFTCFMMSALLMYRRRPFPIALPARPSPQVNSHQATQFARLSPSWVRPKVSLTQNSGKVRSARSVALATSDWSNLVHACLCAHVELVTPVRHTKEDSVLPSCFDSRHSFHDSRDHEEDLLCKMRQCLCELAPLAQLVGCLAIWTSSAPVHHRHGVLHKPNQYWVCPPGIPVQSV